MKVFLSWSGQKSKDFAEAWREWLPYIVCVPLPDDAWWADDYDGRENAIRPVRSLLQDRNRIGRDAGGAVACRKVLREHPDREVHSANEVDGR